MMRFFLVLIAVSAGLMAQSFPPHVAMDALLDIRFFPQQGGFMMATSVPVLFPPPGETKARLLIKKAGGGAAVVTKAMIVEPWPPHAAFGNLKPADGQVGFGPITAGDYVMSVEINGKEISAYPFSLKAEQGGDPFNPKNSLVRTGPWSKAAFLIGPVEDNGASVEVGIWLSTRELPEYVPRKQVPYTLHLMTGGKQMGLVEGMVSDDDWTLFKPEVRQGHGGGPVKWKVLIGTPGAYTLEYRAAGKTIRTYKFQVAGGKVSRIAQNEVGYAGTDALPPQSLIADRRREEFWLAPIQ
ncbi:MAG: hypothetical protein NTV52_03485 [Acidobacteria bacterium]|nr:hypothetical protein [Acidobacteriota bacterium]